MAHKNVDTDIAVFMRRKCDTVARLEHSLLRLLRLHTLRAPSHMIAREQVVASVAAMELSRLSDDIVQKFLVNQEGKHGPKTA